MKVDFSQGSTIRGLAWLLLSIAGYFVLQSQGLEAANQFVMYGMGCIGALGMVTSNK